MTALLVALLLSQTPNMGLCTVTTGVTTMAQTQDCLNQNAAIIDGHNHSSGEGALVNPAGINITAPLPFNGHPATMLSATEYVDAGPGPSVPLSAWFDGINYCVEDGNANKICLTCNGGVCVGDGGLPAVACVLGVCLKNGCLVFPNGASVCGDNGPGDTIISAVDGGANYVYGDEVLDAGLFCGGNATIDGTEYAGMGNYTAAGQQTGYDAFGLANTTESGANTIETVIDGGYKEISCGMGASDCFRVLWDGGPTPVLTLSHLGVLTIANTIGGTTGDELAFTPGGTGGGTKIAAVSTIDTDSKLTIESKGVLPLILAPGLSSTPSPAGLADAGLVIKAHIDTANTTGSTTISDAGNPCFGFAGTSLTLAAGSNDTAGIITFVSTDGGSTACDPSAPIFTLAFSHAFAAPPAVTLTGCDNPANVVTVGRTLLLDAGWFQVVNASNPTPTINSTYCWTYHVFGLGVDAH